MKIDFSKGLALHRLYGHYTFVREAQNGKKDDRFISHVCQAIKCTGKSNDWRKNLPHLNF